jgi:hypothetical protein
MWKEPTFFESYEDRWIGGRAGEVARALLVPKQSVLLLLKKFGPLEPRRIETRLVHIQQSSDEERVVLQKPRYRCRTAGKRVNAILDLHCQDTCKIWDFHGSDYEECRLLGYKNQVRTPQETHYFSDTEPSQIMLCKI